jgi:SAM-dependent methyltransferase
MVAISSVVVPRVPAEVHATTSDIAGVISQDGVARESDVDVRKQLIARVQSFIDALRPLSQRGPLRVLEAGCGSATHFHFGEDAELVGLDISPSQLARNPLVSGRVLADVQACPLATGSFDAAVCWEVLEHVPDPGRALRHLSRVLRPGGLLVIAVPHVRSLKGVITRVTPHWFHVWAYRHLFGVANAGRNGAGPFPTYARDVLTPSRLTELAATCKLDVLYAAAYEARKQRVLRTRYGVNGILWTAVKSVTRVFSAGRLQAEDTDLVFALVRQPDAAAGG